MSTSQRVSQKLQTHNPIVVYPNKGRLFVLALLCASIVVGAVLVLILDPKYNRILAISGLIAAALIVGGGVTVVDALLRVCSSDPQLVVSGDGITVHLQSLGPAQFAWKDIVSLAPGKLFGSSYLGI